MRASGAGAARVAAMMLLTLRGAPLLYYGEEIGMEGGTGKRVVLDGLEEGETGSFAFDIEVDQDVFGRAVGEEVGEGEGIDL